LACSSIVPLTTEIYTLSLHDALPISGLMTNTLLRLLNIDLGFERDHILTIRSALPYQKYDRNRRADFERRLAAQVSRMPGVKQVDRKSTRLNSSHVKISYAVFCLKKK